MTDSTPPPQASSDPSPADEDGPDSGSTESSDTSSDSNSGEGSGIGDDALPEDVQPGEDNPLAEPLDPDAEETKDADELAMDATQGDDDADDDDSGDAGGDSGGDSDDDTEDGKPVGTASGTSEGPDSDAAGGGSAEDESQA